MIFSVFQKIWVLVILGSPFCGIGATIRIGREMLCLPYAGFLVLVLNKKYFDVCDVKPVSLLILLTDPV